MPKSPELLNLWTRGASQSSPGVTPGLMSLPLAQNLWNGVRGLGGLNKTAPGVIPTFPTPSEPALA